MGIGTSTPATLLHLFGASNALRFSYDGSNYATLSAASNGDLTIANSTTTESSVIVGSGAASQDVSLRFDGQAQDYYLGLDNSDSDKFMIGLGSAIGTTPYLTILSTGSIGIGTTTPSQALTVNGGLFVGTSTTGIPTLYVASTTGRVGIGTSTPSSLLDVAGVAHLRGFSTSTTGLYVDGSGNVGIGTTTPATLFTVATTTNIFNVLSSGRIGIGTTTPSSTLHIIGTLTVSATSSFQGETTIDNGVFGAMNFDTDAGQISWIDMPVTSASATGTIESYTAQIDGNAMLTLYSESDGGGGIKNNRIGIGTTTPSSLLELSLASSTILTLTVSTSTTSYDPYLAFRTGATPATQALVGIDYSDSNKLKLVRGSDISTSTGITIDSSGNLGIATTTPSEVLTVNGGLFVGTSTTGIPTLYVASTTGRVGDWDEHAFQFAGCGRSRSLERLSTSTTGLWRLMEAGMWELGRRDRRNSAISVVQVRPFVWSIAHMVCLWDMWCKFWRRRRP